MIDVEVNGQRLKGHDMIAITPAQGQIDLVFNRYNRDDCITFYENESDIKVFIRVEGKVPRNANWSGEKL
jgi:hypothetical protein